MTETIPNWQGPTYNVQSEMAEDVAEALMKIIRNTIQQNFKNYENTRANEMNIYCPLCHSTEIEHCGKRIIYCRNCSKLIKETTRKNQKNRKFEIIAKGSEADAYRKESSW